MVAHAEHEDVAVEGRAVFLSHDQQALRRGDGMGAAAGNEELVVEDAVVLVRHLLGDHILVLRVRHHHQVLERVVQVAAVVHVDVRGAAVPAAGRHVGHPAEIDGHLRDGAGRDVGGHFLRPVLEALDDGQIRPPRRQLDREPSRLVEGVVAGDAYPRVGVVRGVELAVGRRQVDA